MKTKKRRIALSAVSVLLVIALLAGGTMAWFTDTEKVNANFSAGVLDISVKSGEEKAETLEFKNLRPMLYDNFVKEFVANDKDNNLANNDQDPANYPAANIPAYFKPVEITNEGTLPTNVVLSVDLAKGAECKDGEKQFDPVDLMNGTMTDVTDPDHPVCNNMLKDVLKIFVYKQVGSSWEKIEDVNLNKDYKANEAGTKNESETAYTTVTIPAGGNAAYVIAGYLPETVANAYQGKHFHGELVANAYQTDEKVEGVAPDTTPETKNSAVAFRDVVTGEEIEAPEYQLADGTYLFSAVPYRSANIVLVKAPEKYEFKPAKQSFTATVTDGKIEPAPVFTLKEIGVAKIKVHFVDTENNEIGSAFVSAPEADFPYTVETSMATLPEGWAYNPAAQGGQVSNLVDGNPTDVTFPVKPIVPVTATIAVKYQTADGAVAGTTSLGVEFQSNETKNIPANDYAEQIAAGLPADYQLGSLDGLAISIVDGAVTSGDLVVPVTLQPVNIARTATASADASETNAFLPDKAIDGIVDRGSNNKSRWASAATETEHWLKLDFGKQEPIKGVAIEWERRNVTNYELQISNDGNNWETVYHRTRSYDQYHEIVNLSEAKNARYLRVKINNFESNSEGIDWPTVSIFELEVYRFDVPQA